MHFAYRPYVGPCHEQAHVRIGRYVSPARPVDLSDRYMTYVRGAIPSTLSTFCPAEEKQAFRHITLFWQGDPVFTLFSSSFLVTTAHEMYSEDTVELASELALSVLGNEIQLIAGSRCVLDETKTSAFVMVVVHGITTKSAVQADRYGHTRLCRFFGAFCSQVPVLNEPFWRRMKDWQMQNIPNKVPAQALAAYAW